MLDAQFAAGDSVGRVFGYGTIGTVDTLESLKIKSHCRQVKFSGRELLADEGIEFGLKSLGSGGQG